MTHVAMLLSNPFRPDVRVLKEAESLAARETIRQQVDRIKCMQRYERLYDDLCN